MEDDPVGYPDSLWRQLAELDLIGLLMPEEHGGSGQSMLEGVILYEELGRSLAPSPHFVSAVMAAACSLRRAATSRRRSAPRGSPGRGRLSRRVAGAAAGLRPRRRALLRQPDGDG